MKQLRILGIAMVTAALSYAADLSHRSQAAEPPTEPERFPILTRFEYPRNYGYFIGDEIPLTLLVETSKGVILDLINLPKTGEKHGLFEIRQVHLTTEPATEGGTVYRAAYTLQYFGPAPLTIQFEPLEILYAQSGERLSTPQTYTYKSLLTQPVTLSLARIGPYGPTHALDIKGPAAASRAGLLWGSFGIGALCLMAAIGAGSTYWYRHRKNHQAAGAVPQSPAESTLHSLHQEGAVLRPMAEAALPGVERLQYLLRQYVHATYGLSASTLTTTELEALLHEQPYGKELGDLLERCDTLKYEAPAGCQADAWQLWWEAITVFEKLQHTEVSS
jgi:hypothetical protein